MDRVNPADFRLLNFQYACEQCSHYSVENDQCTIGYGAHLHKHEAQMAKYSVTGHMALCRFIEID